MKIFTSLIAAVVFFMTPSCKQDQKQINDEKAIRDIILQMTEGFNKHDAKASTQMYTSDADFVNVRGNKYTGAAEIQEKSLCALIL